MEFVPETHIIHQHCVDKESKDANWSNLGIDVCNIYRSGSECQQILSNSFGKSSPYAKYSAKFTKLFIPLASILDDIVCDTYPGSQYDIECNGEITGIVSVFYGPGTMKKYPVKYSHEYKGESKKYKHTLTFDDKQYILTFIERTIALIDFLETKFDLYNENTREKKIEKQKLFVVINKFKKLFEKKNIINDIVVLERP